MLTLFWNERGVILEHHTPRWNTVTTATYADLLKNHLRPAIKSKQRGLLSTDVLHQHDKVQPHTAHLTFATIQDLYFECLPHPSYSRELVSSGFHVFGSLKEVIRTNLSRPTKRCSRRCMSGCAFSQIIFFLEVYMLFRSAGTL